MIDMSKENAETLALRLNSWQKEKPKTEADKSEVYDICYNLALRIVSHNHSLGLSSTDRQDFTIFLAEEIYMLVITRDNIGDHYNYVNKIVVGYLSDWYKNNCRHLELYNVKALARYDPASPLRYTPFEIEAITDKQETSQLVRNLFKELNKCVRYSNVFSNSVSRINAHVTINLSIKYGKFTNFRLNKSDESACRFLYNKFRIAFQKIVSDAHKSVISDEQYLNYIACELRGDDEDESN